MQELEAVRVVDKITNISLDRPIVDSDGSLTAQSRTFFRSLTDRALIVGTGTPEGNVSATQSSIYMNDAGVSGAILYIKRDDADVLGDKTKGWILT